MSRSYSAIDIMSLKNESGRSRLSPGWPRPLRLNIKLYAGLVVEEGGTFPGIDGLGRSRKAALTSMAVRA